MSNPMKSLMDLLNSSKPSSRNGTQSSPLLNTIPPNPDLQKLAEQSKSFHIHDVQYIDAQRLIREQRDREQQRQRDRKLQRLQLLKPYVYIDPILPTLLQVQEEAKPVVEDKLPKAQKLLEGLAWSDQWCWCSGGSRPKLAEHTEQCDAVLEFLGKERF